MGQGGPAGAPGCPPVKAGASAVGLINRPVEKEKARAAARGKGWKVEYIPLVFDPAAGQPLYQQLYSYLAGQIAAGGLAAGERLPSKRSAAANLGVSLSTVETAFSMLVAEGYLQPRPRSGFYVADISPLLPPAIPAGAGPGRPAAAGGSDPGPGALRDERPPLSGEGPQKTARPAPRPAREDAPAGASWQYDLQTSGVDAALFPARLWGRTVREVLAGDPGLPNPGPAQGELPLRAAVAGYLQAFRGVRCQPGQIVVGAGTEYLLGLLARLLTGPVAVEEPGYPKARRILENNGRRVLPIPLDPSGLRVDLLAASGAQAAYLTPSHQFPTGLTMPVARRSALLQWAAGRPGRVIVEDDYDSEFRFDGKPVPSLQGLDRYGRVVYLGTFSRSLAPGIRIGYLVLPPALLERYHRLFAGYSCTVSRLEQQTLAHFLARGQFTRSVNRARGQYRRRRDLLAAGLKGALGPNLTLFGAHTGLHLVACPGLPLSEQELKGRAAAAGVRLSGLSEYGQPPGWIKGPALVLGYGRIEGEQIPGAVDCLRRAWCGAC